ncbi:fumarate/nitrate reduction transcriptional regulator Fnr [Marinobacter bryozoorum]|uniref:fumarate/nitrate reduction transcriptional regulator Fnr n=1 Tax=Marinobacter bryozoorum TaxID=256324 RepID=UPI002004BD75|nr:fumarate/nitrate reduction transcriptional regulator Fnr [Marinobacter bryozoorum]MCK7542995.1 fumarate/nitrate reduction transcriptional regulator Fnr [Marinobacter bryozoorum]
MSQSIPVNQMSSISKSSCQRCSLSNLCLPLALDSTDMNRLDEVVNRDRIFNRGEQVFTQSTPFRSCYAVKSGAIKTSVITESGDEQITGFFMPGELVGLDSMSDEIHASTAKALERTSVCEIPVEQLENLANTLPGLQHHMFHLMSQEIRNSHQLSVLLSKNTAEERIAALLLSLSSRFQRRKLSPTHFNLPMARNDIANFLGLAVETVSRVFTRFQNQGLIRAKGRDIELVDLEALQTMALGNAQP